MTSKDRVKNALQRQPVDRVPIFMWFHPQTARHLAELLEIPVAFIGEAMGNDVRQAWVNNNHAMEGIVHEHDGEWHRDAWGIRWVKSGAFNQIAEFPLADVSPAAWGDYEFPYGQFNQLLANMEPVDDARLEYFIGADVSPCVFEMYWRLRGMEAALEDLACHQNEALMLLERCADFACALALECCARYSLDWLWTGDDVAGQQSMIMSPELWRDMVGPQLSRVVAVGKSRGLPVAYHSCGAVRVIIPDLIEMGINVLNPVQCNCPGMNPLELKTEFGRELSFMGGVDTQSLLPRGTAKDVFEYTIDLIDGMTADGGGYILAASHTVPPETPDANIFALYAAAGVSKEAIMDTAADIRHRVAAPVM